MLLFTMPFCMIRVDKELRRKRVWQYGSHPATIKTKYAREHRVGPAVSEMAMLLDSQGFLHAMSFPLSLLTFCFL